MPFFFFFYLESSRWKGRHFRIHHAVQSFREFNLLVWACNLTECKGHGGTLVNDFTRLKFQGRIPNCQTQSCDITDESGKGSDGHECKTGEERSGHWCKVGLDVISHDVCKVTVNLHFFFHFASTHFDNRQTDNEGNIMALRAALWQAITITLPR